ncbi:AraC family transcriptional regulator [Chitinimonas viridis]|uniref:AraC family transcriptional regulator n=1 Tax=Chitinimonas viridis TaxID=664880 RepID=A0ABT8B2A2_9NEIS|nr:AraC family transcriptional regulator [Chitinimonas viridis]MDN3575950.1 AraC family transcriptional regulator [Chitinimonas viridis]
MAESLLLAAAPMPQGEADMPLADYLAMFEAALAATDPLFGWRLGQQVKPTTYGVNGILLLACPTLGLALEQVLRFEALVHDLGRSSLLQQEGVAVYSWRNDMASHAVAGALAESVFSGIKTCAEWLAGRPVMPIALEFTHAAPSGSSLASLAGVEVAYGCPINRVVFPAELLALPIPQANNGLLPLLQGHAEALLRERHQTEPAIVGQVRQVVLNNLGEGGLKLADVAQALHLSTRTLQRRLTEAGMAFQDLLDTTRHELARHYLVSSAMPIGEIAYLLGYRDPAAFHHAFKGWQGEGPGSFRGRSQRPESLL